MIFDTSFIIDLMRNDEKAVAKMQELVKNREPLLITAPTILELFSGLTRSNTPLLEKNKVMAVLKGQTILPFDNNAAEAAGEIDGMLVKEGAAVGPIDCMIAAIALGKKDKLLTRNIKDFRKIKGIIIETY